METIVKRLYEAMFLIDSAQAQSDWDAVNTTIKNILQRAEAEIVSIKKWDDRRLAYEINGHSRGTYILCYFRVDGKRIREIERDVQLSERIMRVLILCADHIREEDIEKGDPAVWDEKHKEAAEEAEKLEQSAEPVAVDADESEQPESETETKGEKVSEEPLDG